MPEVLVIGAGLAGMACARRLQLAGVTVSLVDKGRRAGGRLTTRREDVPGRRWDHGAQYFTAREARFRKFVAEAVDAGVVTTWTDHFATDPKRSAAAGSTERYPRYCGTGGMSGLAQWLSTGLKIRQETRIARLEAVAAGYRAVSEDGVVYLADAVVATPPVPQTLLLLQDSGVVLPAELSAPLQAIQYAPCLAVLVALDGPSQVPVPGGLFTGPEPIGWIADNTQKGIASTAACVTLHAGPEFSRTHYETPEAEVCALLVASAQPWLAAPIVSVQLHRWKYSIPLVVYPERCAVVSAQWQPPLVLAGDAFGGPRVEGAWLSGEAAAEAVLQRLPDWN